MSLKQKINNPTHALVQNKNKLCCEKAKIVLLENKFAKKKSTSDERGVKYLSRKQKIILDAMTKEYNTSNAKGMRYSDVKEMQREMASTKSAKASQNFRKFQTADNLGSEEQ